MTYVFKPKKMAIATSSLVETQSKKTIYYWRCGESNHTKNDSNYPKKKKTLYIEKFKSKFEMTKVRNKF